MLKSHFGAKFEKLIFALEKTAQISSLAAIVLFFSSLNVLISFLVLRFGTAVSVTLAYKIFFYRKLFIVSMSPARVHWTPLHSVAG